MPLKQADIPTDVQIMPTPIEPKRREFLRPAVLAKNHEMMFAAIDKPETISRTITELDGVMPAIIKKYVPLATKLTPRNCCMILT